MGSVGEGVVSPSEQGEMKGREGHLFFPLGGISGKEKWFAHKGMN